MAILLMAAAGALSLIVAVWGYSLTTGGRRVAGSAVPARARARRKRADLPVLDALADLLGRPFTGPATELLAPWRDSIRKRIDAAGRPGGLTVESYARQTAGYVLMFGPGGILLILNGQVLFGVLCLVGVAQKELLLYSRMRRRQDEIQRMLPDFLDVLSVTVSAGLNFRGALARVAECMPGALAEEFTVALRQMELGTPRREAFEDLRRRNRSESLGRFVGALLQAEELGAPLATALTDIATDMRRESAQLARRQAQRLTPRVTAVTTAMTLPAVMAMVLGSILYSSGVDFGGLLDGP